MFKGIGSWGSSGLGLPNLPEDVLNEMFDYLSPRDKGNLVLVNKDLQESLLLCSMEEKLRYNAWKMIKMRPEERSRSFEQIFKEACTLPPVKRVNVLITLADVISKCLKEGRRTSVFNEIFSKIIVAGSNFDPALKAHSLSALLQVVKTSNFSDIERYDTCMNIIKFAKDDLLSGNNFDEYAQVLAAFVSASEMLSAKKRVNAFNFCKLERNDLHSKNNQFSDFEQVTSIRIQVKFLAVLAGAIRLLPRMEGAKEFASIQKELENILSAVKKTDNQECIKKIKSGVVKIIVSMGNAIGKLPDNEKIDAINWIKKVIADADLCGPETFSALITAAFALPDGDEKKLALTTIRDSLKDNWGDQVSIALAKVFKILPEDWRNDVLNIVALSMKDASSEVLCTWLNEMIWLPKKRKDDIFFRILNVCSQSDPQIIDSLVKSIRWLPGDSRDKAFNAILDSMKERESNHQVLKASLDVILALPIDSILSLAKMIGDDARNVDLMPELCRASRNQLNGEKRRKVVEELNSIVINMEHGEIKTASLKILEIIGISPSKHALY